MPKYRKKFAVKPGCQIRLKHFDPGYRDKHGSRKSASPEIEKNRQKMDELQYLMYAENKHSLLVILQGLDAGGKDGTVRHVFTGMNPAGCVSVGFKQPTPKELAHDFLWRVHPHLLAKGSVVIFTRSHYEDVLVARVHDLVPKKIWSARYDEINDFEQLARFEKRLDDPARQWKISESDYKERGYWDDYTKAFEDVLNKTSTERAPWFIIPSNHKWFRDLAISEIIVRAMKDMDMQLPKPSVNLTEIRRKYHQAVDQEKSRREKKR